MQSHPKGTILKGSEVSALRNALAMNLGQFAQLIGVNHSTLWRWEAAGAEEIRIDPLQGQLLTVLHQQIAARRTESERRKFAEMLLAGLLIGGGMLALFKLLEAAFGSTGQRRNAGAGPRAMVAPRRSSAQRKRKP
jgi:hypothetical protein